jgi:hypothetical protein
MEGNRRFSMFITDAEDAVGHSPEPQYRQRVSKAGRGAASLQHPKGTDVSTLGPWMLAATILGSVILTLSGLRFRKRLD